MSRRKALALAAAAVVAPALPPVSVPAELEAARAYLLPGLWGIFGVRDSGVEADIVIQNGGLLVLAWKSDLGRAAAELGFFISRTAVRDGRHADAFVQTAPVLRALVEHYQ